MDFQGKHQHTPCFMSEVFLQCPKQKPHEREFPLTMLLHIVTVVSSDTSMIVTVISITKG